jgi:cell division protein DivIC
MEGKKLIIGTILCGGILIVIFLPGLTELQHLREDNEDIQKRVMILEKQNRELEREILLMQEDPIYAENKAREKLGIVRKGEYVYESKQE